MSAGKDDPKDDRSDIQRAVEERKDAVERGEGGPEHDPLKRQGDADGVGGTGGVTKNQDSDAQ
jgi:hypothetical protein